jgi:hypothetical protein
MQLGALRTSTMARLRDGAKVKHLGVNVLIIHIHTQTFNTEGKREGYKTHWFLFFRFSKHHTKTFYTKDYLYDLHGS